MAQRIIMIHGRSTKPARARHVALWKEALHLGVKRFDPSTARKFKRRVADRKLAVDVVYYGDILNRILAEESVKVAGTLTAKDAAFGDAACLPFSDIRGGLANLMEIPRFDSAAYSKVARDNPAARLQDNMAGFFSFMSGLATLGLANKAAIGKAMPDLRDYFHEQAVGSAIRKRLHEKLNPALKRKDDIMLVSHSMGCIVSYDALWKISRRSEYADLWGQHKISKWITIGCPLAEHGVRRNLIDHDQHGRGKYPSGVVKDWLNIAAEGDYVAHERKMRAVHNFRPMERKNHVDKITDKFVYNCYAQGGKSNPHKAYGYIAHATMGRAVGAWMK